MGKRVLIPLPDNDFDVTEVAVPWRLLTRAGHQVVFATERPGVLPAADPRLLAGVILGGCVGQQIRELRGQEAAHVEVAVMI